jgi:hypothetical protein
MSDRPANPEDDRRRGSQTSDGLTKLLLGIGTAVLTGLAKEAAVSAYVRFVRWQAARAKKRQRWVVTDEMRSSYYPLDDADLKYKK